MFGRKPKRLKSGIGTLIFLMLFGLVFAAAGLFIRSSMQIDPNWTIISGEIIDVSRNSGTRDRSDTYSPIVEYVVDGQAYIATSNFSSSSYPTIGGSKEVAYNPLSPGESKIVQGGFSKLLWLIFFLIGVLCFVLGPVLFIRSHIRGRDIKKLIGYGLKLQGVLVDVKTTGGKQKSSKILVSAVDLAGQVQTYESDSLTDIANLYMADYRKNPIAIDVYLDPTDHENYYVDISDIKGITPQRINDLIKLAQTNANPENGSPIS